MFNFAVGLFGLAVTDVATYIKVDALKKISCVAGLSIGCLGSTYGVTMASAFIDHMRQDRPIAEVEPTSWFLAEFFESIFKSLAVASFPSVVAIVFGGVIPEFILKKILQSDSFRIIGHRPGSVWLDVESFMGGLRSASCVNAAFLFAICLAIENITLAAFCSAVLTFFLIRQTYNFDTMRFDLPSPSPD